MKIEFAPDEAVQVHVLDGSGDPFEARLHSCTGRHLFIAAEVRLARGTPLRLQWTHHLLLAEVMAQNDTSVIELQIRHALDQRDIDHFHRVWEWNPQPPREWLSWIVPCQECDRLSHDEIELTQRVSEAEARLQAFCPEPPFGEASVHELRTREHNAEQSRASLLRVRGERITHAGTHSLTIRS